MSATRVSQRWPHRPALIAGLVVLAILVAAVVDHQITYERLPDLPVFTAEHPAGSDPAVAEAEDLREGFVGRAWLYSLGLIAAVTALLAVSLRAAPRERWRELFTDLGVAAVCAFGLAIAFSLNGPKLLEVSSKAPIWLPPVLMLVTAGAGSLLTRRTGSLPPAPAGDVGVAGPGASPPDPGSGVRAPVVSHIGALAGGLAGLALVLLMSAGGNDDCDVTISAWSEAALLAAVCVSLIVAFLGIVALFARRWVVALLSIPYPAFVALFAFAAAGGGCLA